MSHVIRRNAVVTAVLYFPLQNTHLPLHSSSQTAMVRQNLDVDSFSDYLESTLEQEEVLQTGCVLKKEPTAPSIPPQTLECRAKPSGNPLLSPILFENARSSPIIKSLMKKTLPGDILLFRVLSSERQKSIGKTFTMQRFSRDIVFGDCIGTGFFFPRGSNSSTTLGFITDDDFYNAMVSKSSFVTLIYQVTLGEGLAKVLYSLNRDCEGFMVKDQQESSELKGQLYQGIFHSYYKTVKPLIGPITKNIVVLDKIFKCKKV